MSGLRHWGLDWLSPSQLTTYRTGPAYWFLQKGCGVRSEPNAAMVRGNAAESGICHGLFNPEATVEDCQALAIKEYDEKLRFSNDPKFESERNNLPGLVEYGLKELRQYGIPSSAQENIKISLPDVPVPIIGRTDLVYDDHGLVIDIKTTLRMPSKISDNHALQGAIYAHAKSNYSMRFAYVKPKPSKGEDRACNVYEMSADEVRERLNEAREIALRMDRFLSLSKDKDELAALLVPDYSGYQWGNENIREEGRKLFGW